MLTIISLSFAGGFIINFMPCILPVLSLKLLSFSKKPSSMSILCYILGIMTVFNAISICSIIFQQFGASFGFGMHFQNPAFIIAISILMLVFISISLDRISITTLGLFANNLLNIRASGYFLEFCNGLITGALSTSCSAPLLGSAISFAISAPTLVNIAIFNTIGVGFCAPYIAIYYYPGLINFLPKSGKWLDVIKKIISVLLILTLFWLLFIAYSQMGLRASAGLLCILVLIKAIIESSQLKAIIKMPLFVLLVCSAFYFPQIASRDDQLYKLNKDSLWLDFSQFMLTKGLSQQRLVFVDVTADWCATCKLNKLLVLDRSWTISMLARNHVIALRASLNLPNQQASEFMARNQSYAIPFNIVYGPAAPDGIKLPILYSYQDLKNALKSASIKPLV